MDPEPNMFLRFMRGLRYTLDGPVDYVREKIVVPNQKKYPWYHQQFRRVPSIDECHELDVACIYEADAQFKRDMMVDNEILAILRKRYEHCCWVHGDDRKTLCSTLYDMYNEAATNWFIKYGDLGAKICARYAFMKQKHRMVWERRHGPVGSGTSQDHV